MLHARGMLLLRQRALHVSLPALRALSMSPPPPLRSPPPPRADLQLLLTTASGASLDGATELLCAAAFDRHDHRWTGFRSRWPAFLPVYV